MKTISIHPHFDNFYFILTFYNENISSFIDPKDDDDDAHRYQRLMTW